MHYAAEIAGFIGAPLLMRLVFRMLKKDILERRETQWRNGVDIT